MGLLTNVEQARKLLNETLKKMIEERRKSHKEDSGGLLRVMLGATDQNNKLNLQLSDSQIADNIIGVIFAAHDTTASVLTWLIKYLHDNADLLEAVTVIFLSLVNLPKEKKIPIFRFN